MSLALSFVLALLVGLFSLRVRAIFFSMITLAVAAAFQTLASQLSDITGGEDGLTFKMPELLSPGFQLSETPFLGVTLDGRLICYYLLFVTAVVLLLAMLRIVNSPFGRVLQAIRENEFRAEAIGYRVVVYRTTSSILSALFATVAGAMLAIWLRYNGPDTSLSFEIMLDVLLIVVIGGMGTIYGAAIGSGVFVVAQSYLQDLLKLASDATSGAALAVGAAVAGPLAALAGPAVRALRLLLPDRHRRAFACLAEARRVSYFLHHNEGDSFEQENRTGAVRAPSIHVDPGRRRHGARRLRRQVVSPGPSPSPSAGPSASSSPTDE